MAAFGLVSLLLAGALAVGTYLFIRDRLVDEREAAARRQAYTNARLVRNRLRSSEEDLPTLLSGLQVVGTGDVLLERTGRWYSSSVSADRSIVPAGVQTAVSDGHAAHQIVTGARGPTLVIGVPIAELSAQLYVVESLEDLEATLALLRSALSGAAVLAALVGAVAGAAIGRRVMRPLRDVSDAAQRIASGDDDTRLPPSDDPDLEPLIRSFNDMVDELDERARREARFASDVSHDLRGPLTALAAATAVVHHRRDQLPADAIDAVDALDDLVRSFNRLVVDLLEISRFEAGTASVDARVVDVAELVGAVLSERPTSLPVVVDAGGPYLVDVDPRRIRRALLNLLENADNYAGGACCITIEQRSPRTVIVSVDDHGPGVPPDQREAVFDRYERGPATRNPGAARGTGLGLALVAQHVALHHGRVWVEDNDGGGARFVVELPVAT